MHNHEERLIYLQRPQGAPKENRYSLLYISIMVACLAAFVMGYDTVLISSALLSVQEFFNLSTDQIEVLVSSVLGSAIVGAIIAWPFSVFLGRKKSLVLSSIFFIAGSIVEIFAPYFPLIILGRWIVGLGLGMASVTAIIYVSEIVPRNIRGSSVCFFNFLYNLGVVFAFLIGLIFFKPEFWRWILASSLIPASIFAFLLYKVPETPQWYIFRRKQEKAKQMLLSLRRSFEVQSEYEALEESILEEEQKKTSYRGLLKALFIGTFIAFFMEFTGMDALYYYGPLLLKTLGYESNHASIASTLILSCCSLLFSFVAILLIDLWGRRRLLLLGLIIMFVSLILTGFVFLFGDDTLFRHILSIFTLVCFSAGFSIGIGTVGWLLISELFPWKVRSFSVSLCLTVKWIANFLIARSFLTTVEDIGLHKTFWFYALVSAVAWILVYFFVPETNGKSLESIEEFWMESKKHGIQIEL